MCSSDLTPVMVVCMGRTVLAALSGNPFAMFVNLQLFVRPILAALTGDVGLALRPETAEMENDYPKGSPMRRFLRAALRDPRARVPAPGENSPGIRQCGGQRRVDRRPRRKRRAARGRRRADLAGPIRVRPCLPAAQAPRSVEMSFPLPLTARPPVVCICGAKKSGKTLLMARLVRHLSELGLVVGTLKHDGHDFDLGGSPDREGTDSWRHRAAGARALAGAEIGRASCRERV